MTHASHVAPTDGTTGWQAGLARLDITPPLHAWLAGFGGRTKGAQGVHDPLHVTALALASGRSQAIILSCDLLSLDAEDAQRARNLIAEETGVPTSHILVHTTHTHSGPLTSKMRGFGWRDQAYDSILMRKIVSTAALATQCRQPVRLTYATAHAPIGVNRRMRVRDSVVIGENPEGPVDSRAAVLGIWPIDPASEQPIGLVLWAAVHPVMFGSSNYLVGRDFPGYAIDYLERTFPGSICLYLTGTAGDVNPLGMREDDRFGMAKRHGGVLAGAAMQALFCGQAVEPAPLVGVVHNVRVPLKPLPPIETLRQEKEALELGFRQRPDGALLASLSGSLAWVNEALASLEGAPAAPAYRDAFEAELQCLLLGDLALTALPFEVFTAYGTAAAESAPGTESLVVGYANGDYGYLPTSEAFAEGGYEVAGSYRYYSLQELSPEAPAHVLAAIEELHAQARALI